MAKLKLELLFKTMTSLGLSVGIWKLLYSAFNTIRGIIYHADVLYCDQSYQLNVKLAAGVMKQLV